MGEKKKPGRPRKTVSDSEKIEHKEAVRSYVERMKETAHVFKCGWIKLETWEEIQKISEEEDLSIGQIIDRAVAVFRVKKNSIHRNTPSDN